MTFTDDVEKRLRKLSRRMGESEDWVENMMLRVELDAMPPWMRFHEDKCQLIGTPTEPCRGTILLVASSTAGEAEYRIKWDVMHGVGRPVWDKDTKPAFVDQTAAG